MKNIIRIGRTSCDELVQDLEPHISRGTYVGAISIERKVSAHNYAYFMM